MFQLHIFSAVYLPDTDEAKWRTRITIDTVQSVNSEKRREKNSRNNGILMPAHQKCRCADWHERHPISQVLTFNEEKKKNAK